MTKGGVNLYTELKKHKLNKIAARNIHISLSKHIQYRSKILDLKYAHKTRLRVKHP